MSSGGNNSDIDNGCVNFHDGRVDPSLKVWSCLNTLVEGLLRHLQEDFMSMAMSRKCA